MHPITHSLSTNVAVTAGSGNVDTAITKDHHQLVINLVRIANTPSKDRQTMSLGFMETGAPAEKDLISEDPARSPLGKLCLLRVGHPREMKHVSRIADCVNHLVNHTANSRHQRNTIRHLYQQGERWLSGEFSQAKHNDPARAAIETELKGGLRYVYVKENQTSMPDVRL